MAIVNVQSSFFPAMVSGIWTPPFAASRDGKDHVIQGTVANGATDSSGSTYKLFTLPWTAILLPDAAFRTDGWGFAQVQIGPAEAPLGLLNAAKGVSTTGQLPVTIFGTRWNQPFWQACGLASIPTDKPFCDVIVTTIAGATGAGTMSFYVPFVTHVN